MQASNAFSSILGTGANASFEDDLRLYSWLSETHERERIADLGEVV
jgi:hypothetical protein